MMDIGEAGLMRRQLLAHVRASEAPAVVVDLSEVTFMDCAGLEPLLAVDRWLARRNRRLVLQSVSAQVEFLFTNLRRAGLVLPFEQPEGSEVTEPDPYDDVELVDDEDLVRILDPIHVVEAERLGRQFKDRPLIEEATGLLMAVHECAAAPARGWLTRVAREHRMTASDLAAGLAALAAARGGRSTLDLSPASRTAVRAVLTHPGIATAAEGGLAPPPTP